MINKQQRKQLSEIIRHLGSGTISFKDFKRKRYEIFGNDADFDDLEFNDENIHDITAITLSCEALYLCELLKKKGMWERWFKSELKQGYDLRKKISLICLFLYSDLDLYCFDKAIKMSPPYYKYDTLLLFLSSIIFIGGFFGSAFFIASCFYDYLAISMAIALSLIFSVVIFISEYTKRQNELITDKFEKECFFKYPFISKENYDSISTSKDLLGTTRKAES